MGNENTKETKHSVDDVSVNSVISLQESDIDEALPTLSSFLSQPKPATGSRLKIQLAVPNATPSISSISTISNPSPIAYSSTCSSPNYKYNPYPTTTGNGVTGNLISEKICRIVALFWFRSVANLPMDQQQEIACSIFFSMISTNKEMRSIMKTKDIEAVSLKYLHMIGWLARSLMDDQIDLYPLLRKLGAIHRRIGVRIQHFVPMLVAMHETFSYYFPKQYSIEVKYALDEIFTLSAQIMTNQELKHSSYLNEINGTLNNDNIIFLQSLRVCLQSSIGTEYLTKYLQEKFCDEIVIFLQLIKNFRKQVTDKARFMTAREIVKSCINPKAIFAVNICYEARQTVLHEMRALENKFPEEKQFIVSANMFAQVEMQIHRLIRVNHWDKFVESMKELQLKSNQL